MTDFYVYLHRKKTTKEVFYVGKGSGDRVWSRAGRSSLFSSKPFKTCKGWSLVEPINP